MRIAIAEIDQNRQSVRTIEIEVKDQDVDLPFAEFSKRYLYPAFHALFSDRKPSGKIQVLQ